MGYEHTQTSPAIRVVPIVLLGAFVITAFITQRGVVLLPVAGFVILLATILLVASRLTTTVSAQSVQAAFGFGWPRRTIALREIVTADEVRNRWIYGWGIRLVPKGWMFNVWGLDAVELELTSGRRFRIGTDEPAELAGAITSALGADRSGPA
ncbi:MAG: hypothetical protein AAF567_13035 [Actinomycetota bacterium]